MRIYCLSCSPTHQFTPMLTRMNGGRLKRWTGRSSTFPLLHLWVIGFSTLITRHTHSHTHAGVTSAVERPRHPAASAGAACHRCSQWGPQSSSPLPGEFRVRQGDRKSVSFVLNTHSGTTCVYGVCGWDSRKMECESVKEGENVWVYEKVSKMCGWRKEKKCVFAHVAAWRSLMPAGH